MRPMTQVDCTVHQIVLRTADLRKLNEPERRLFLTRITHVTSPPRGDPLATYPAGIDVMCQEQPLASKSLNHFVGAQLWPPPIPSLESRG
jgi:hypothetical protein